MSNEIQDTPKYYHVTEAGLVEGEALGRISVVLKADYGWIKQRLDESLGLLSGVHTGGLFGPDDWETVNTFLTNQSSPKICECGPLRNITEGGHFPACTRCHRRLRADRK